MKTKNIFLALLTLILALTLSIGGFAVELNEDSVKINNEVKNKMKDKSDDVVLILYSASFMHRFAEKIEIEDMISYDVNEKYLVVSKDSYQYKRIINNDDIVTIQYASTDWSETYKNAINPKAVFEAIDSEIIIYQIYCLDGASNHDGHYIYYKTNKGDFVFYKQYSIVEKEYLMPIEKFYEFAEIAWAERTKYPENDGGILDLSQIYDLSDYEIKIDYSQTPGNLKTHKLYAIIVACAVLVLGACGITMFFISKNKKLKTKN